MATNSLLTINMITREALRLFRNSNYFLRNVNRQFDDSFAKTGAKIGSTLRIRLPNDYIVNVGKTITPENTTEVNTTLTVATQANVPISFGSAEKALSLDDFSSRILKPAVNNLAGYVAADLMNAVEGSCNYVSKTDGAGNLLSPDASTWLLAGAKLDNNSAPKADRKIILDPLSQARTVASLAGLFNPQRKVSDQYVTGEMQEDTLGFDWGMDQTVIKHTNGSFTAGTVSTGGQTGNTLATNAITGSLNKGDIITIAGVFAINRITKNTTGELQQFVVTAAVTSGATAIPIYPAITPGNVQYGTVTASPLANATITLLGGANLIYRKNFAYHPEAFALATADMELPKGVHEAARESYDNLSCRIVSQYAVLSDDFITRLDVLYGYQSIRPEWIVCVPDVL